MKCGTCGRDMEKVIGPYSFKSKIIGSIILQDVEQVVCNHCETTYLDTAEAIRVSNYIDDREKSAIQALPIGEFITAGEAVEILGVSEQAFSKNRRIKRGFIYSVNLGGRKFFYRPSVIAFAETGDGRISLAGSGKEKTVLLVSAIQDIWTNHPTMVTVGSQLDFEVPDVALQGSEGVEWVPQEPVIH